MREYSFLIESPSTEDLFDSKSHERTAISVFETLQQDNKVNLIGVEGELGSGKSTQIELVLVRNEYKRPAKFSR
ncbi:MAG: HrpA-like RNA helicase [Paraglaciecola sp.]